MRLRFHADELQRIREIEMPWWSAEPRQALGLVVAGEPAVETDDTGQPTGYYVMDHPGITAFEVWLLDLLRAGWAYVDGLGDDGEGLDEYQAAVDWATWADLLADYLAGRVTRAEAFERIQAHAFELAGTLGVALPVAPVEDV